MEYLVLGPAGMGIFTILGSIIKYEDEIKNVKEISGSSAGAVLAVAIALEIPLHDVLDRLLSIDFENLTKFKIKNFISKFGFIDTSVMRKVMMEACGCDPTFSELKKKVIISSYCLNRAITEYFSVDTHPHMKVLDAVCMSIAIPVVFTPVKYNGMFYVDGGTRERFPITPFIDKKPEKIMCICVRDNDVYIENIRNVKGFLQSLVMTATRALNTNTLKLGKMIELDIKHEDMFKFTMNYEHKLTMFIKGSVS